MAKCSAIFVGTAFMRIGSCFAYPRTISSSVHHYRMMTTQASMVSDSHSHSMDASVGERTAYGLSHVVQYLNQIEECIQSSTTPSPAIKYQHAYNREGSESFYKVLSGVLAKPMLRTLIYGGDKVDSSTLEWKNTKIYFDQRIREARSSSEGTRMHSFVIHSLKSAALVLDTDIRDEKVPNLLDQIELIEQKIGEGNPHAPMVWGSATNRSLFHRLASGRKYKGKLQDLISDVFPQLYEKYLEANRKSTEREVLEQVMKSDLIESNSAAAHRLEQRIKAAYICLDRFYPIQSTSERQDGGDGLQEGKKCEKSCISFLENEYTTIFGKNDQTYSILNNVYINTRRNVDQTQQKYVPPKTLKRGSRRRRKSGNSGVIWNDASRHRMTSEFDAIVLGTTQSTGEGLEPNNIFIESIWEAKKTISPSTLHDIISKKLGAVIALLEDGGAELVCTIEGNKMSIPFHNQNMQLTFGIYGSELTRPENAADSIRSIAGSNVVSSDVDAVIRSLERAHVNNEEVMVEVKFADALDIVRGLKSVIENFDQNQVDVLLFVEEEIDFL